MPNAPAQTNPTTAPEQSTPQIRLAETLIEPTATLKRSVVGQHCELGHHAALSDSQMADFSYIGPFTMLDNAEIGRFCSIAAHVRVGAPNHPMQRPSMHRFSYCTEYYSDQVGRDADFFAERRAARTYVGNDVWIGHGVIVLPGLTIGDGAILAAGAVVTKDVAPYTLVAGVPARPMRLRFAPEIVEALCRIRWWDWPLDILIERIEDFRSSDIEAFCRRYG